MPLISFQPWKAAKVESGESRQTIRQVRKYPVKMGDTLYLWQQQRTPQRRKLGETACTAIAPICINQGRVWLSGDSICLPHQQAHELAIADGFDSLDTFLLFFHNNYGHSPFEGVVIQWGELSKPLVEPRPAGQGKTLNQIQLPLQEVI